MLEVADERDLDAVDGATLFGDGIEVEQGLGRMLARTVSAVDDGMDRNGSCARCRAFVGMAQHHDVGVTVDDTDGVLERLALGHGAELHADSGLHRTAEPHEGGAEREAGAGARFEEEIGQKTAAQQVARLFAPRDGQAAIGNSKDAVEVGSAKLRDRNQMGVQKRHGLLPCAGRAAPSRGRTGGRD